MKSRLNITVDKKLKKQIKSYAKQRNISISELVENYFEQLTKSGKQKSIIDVVEPMQVPEIPRDANLVNEYYSDMEKKYDD